MSADEFEMLGRPPALSFRIVSGDPLPENVHYCGLGAANDALRIPRQLVKPPFPVGQSLLLAEPADESQTPDIHDTTWITWAELASTDWQETDSSGLEAENRPPETKATS
ncbi:hypothetical protein [Streptomyces sp. NPDC057748]|uniref:hypothetical protein n=1 Tax=unclassified Streptomyces TaxID=2593676 RepID=UPI0036BD322C